jgi:hypothetical protein
MNSPKQKIVFKQQADAGVMQDKYPPVRINAASKEAATAEEPAYIRRSTNPPRTQIYSKPPADNRPKHHGSESRQTQQVSGRVKPHIKAEVVRVAKLKGWTESKTVADLVEQALTHNLAEQLGVALKNILQEAVTTQMAKADSRAGNLALEAFYSAEESRILTVYLIRLFLGSDIDILPRTLRIRHGRTSRSLCTPEANKTNRTCQSLRLNILETKRQLTRIFDTLPTAGKRSSSNNQSPFHRWGSDR